jgi:hypothetical protein
METEGKGRLEENMETHSANPVPPYIPTHILQGYLLPTVFQGIMKTGKLRINTKSTLSGLHKLS